MTEIESSPKPENLFKRMRSVIASSFRLESLTVDEILAPFEPKRGRREAVPIVMGSVGVQGALTIGVQGAFDLSPDSPPQQPKPSQTETLF